MQNKGSESRDVELEAIFVQEKSAVKVSVGDFSSCGLYVLP